MVVVQIWTSAARPSSYHMTKENIIEVLDICLDYTEKQEKELKAKYPSAMYYLIVIGADSPKNKSGRPIRIDANWLKEAIEEIKK